MQNLNDVSLLAGALSSEQTYFRLGAETHRSDGAIFAVMPGLERLPAASVCIFGGEGVDDGPGECRIADAESRFARAGVAMARIYTPGSSEQFQRLMSGRGYRRRTEIIHAFHPLPRGNAGGTDWRPVESDADWESKAAIHALPSTASDGYDVSPEAWVAFERRKSETGELAFWLYFDTSGPVATTGLMACGPGILRIKNFFVRADCRQKGVGTAALAALLRQTQSAGENAVVVLSIEGSVGERLYRSAGARAIGRIYEWSRSLG